MRMNLARLIVQTIHRERRSAVEDVVADLADIRLVSRMFVDVFENHVAHARAQ